MGIKSVTNLFVSWLGGIRKSQVKTLAALTYGLVRSARVGVAAIGRSMAGPVAEKHRIKRVDRFLGNLGVKVVPLVRPLVRASMANRERVFLAIDWTDLHDQAHQVLVAGVVTRSRAIPVYWRTVSKGQLTLNQNRIEDRFVEELRKLVPRGVEVVVLADRGFGRVSFLQKLESLGFKYLIRVQNKVGVRGEVFTGTLGDLPVQRGVLLDLGKVKYQQQVGFPVRVVVRFDQGQEEPWLLATNLDESAERVAGWYGRRMEIEELFKDLKNERSGFRLRGLRLSSPGRYDRLLLVVAYAYFLLVVAGLWGEMHQVHRRLMANTEKKRTLGLWRVGHYVFNNLSICLEQIMNGRPALAFSG